MAFMINGGGPMPPCRKDCPDRSPTCHANCEAYRAFTKEREEFRKFLLMENDIYNTVGRRHTKEFFDRRAKQKRDGRQSDR